MYARRPLRLVLGRNILRIDYLAEALEPPVDSDDSPSVMHVLFGHASAIDVARWICCRSHIQAVHRLHCFDQRGVVLHCG